MASKDIIILIDDNEIETKIRRIKKKEFKDLASKLASKADEVVKLLDTKDITSGLPVFIEENVDFICDEMIKPFTNLGSAELDEMDVVDVLNLGKKLLEYNGVSVEKIINFLNPNPAAKQKIAEALNFGGVAVPS